MKKFALAVAALMLAAMFALTGCGSAHHVIIADEGTIVVKISDDFATEGKVFKDYMDYLVKEGELTYDATSGFVNAINGKENAGGCYWMIYTDDAENSNAAYGTVEYEGKTYSQATLGLESLPLKDGALYIWYYQQF